MDTKNTSIYFRNEEDIIMKLYEYWILQYHQNRYMKYLSTEQVNDRLRYLVENLTTLETNGKIGIRNIRISPWTELMIKFTHTVEEINIRNELPKEQLLFNSAVPKPMLEASDRLKEINHLATIKKPHLIKFSKKEYLKNNSFKVSLASSFLDSSLNVAQRDDEMKATFHVNPDNITIKDKHGNIIKPIGNVDFSYETQRDYYVFCTSGEFDIRLFSDFNADSCLFIYNSQKFADELIAELRNHIEIEDFAYKMVEYIDPIQNRLRNSKPIIEFHKHIKYLYQHEYRHVIITKNGSPMPKHIYLTLNSIQNYSELICL